MKRRETKKIMVGRLTMGGGSRILVQSMLSRPSYDVEGNVLQARELQAAGCDIVRAAVPDTEGIRVISALKNAVNMPVVADIHFDYRLAIGAIEAGADKIRINPGNIGDETRVMEVVKAAKAKNIPLRVGVNSGSLEKEILLKHGSPTAEALVESALYHISLIEKYDYDNIAVSIKSSDVIRTIESYRLFSESSRYPLHLGITEAGTERMGLVKSAIGIGSLLADGIGDTIRVSLTDSPIKEIAAANDILRALGLLETGVNLISCPTCGRTRVGLIELAKTLEEALKNVSKHITVAVMGCAVNGPGEAREADIGVACGEGCGLIFKKGETIKKVPEEEIVRELLSEIEKL